MKHLSMIAATITLVAVPTFAADSDNSRRGAQERNNRAERREARQDFEQLVKDINALDDQPAARRAGLAEAARQAGVPLARFETPPKGQAKAGLGSQFLAQEIAQNTRKSAQDILKTRTDGESWTQIAQANKQDLAALERKLTLIHEAMLDPNGDRVRERDRALAAERKAVAAQNSAPAGDSAFDKNIQAVNSLGQDQEAKRLGLDAIARETNLSRREVEQAAEQNKQLGLGDFFVAQQLALQTKKPVSELWNMHLSPKSWTEIAQDNNGNARQIERQLARIEDTMRGRTVRADDAERVRERELRRDNNSTRNTFDEPTFQRSIQSVNSLGQNTEVQRAGLRALSRETSVPLSRIEQAHQQNQNLGMGDLFVAQELSARTKKSVDELWKQHLSPKTWAQVAQENNQDVGEIQRKLARIEQALRDAAK